MNEGIHGKVRSCRPVGTTAETGNTTVGKGRAFGSLPPHPDCLGSEEEGILPSGGQFGVLQLFLVGTLTSLHHTWLYFKD